MEVGGPLRGVTSAAEVPCQGTAGRASASSETWRKPSPDEQVCMGHDCKCIQGQPQLMIACKVDFIPNVPTEQSRYVCDANVF